MTPRGRSSGRRIHGLPPREDVERELRHHLALREDELVEAGWERTAARAEAQRLFGDYRAIRREATEVATRHARISRRQRMWGEFVQDVRYALRWLAREPGFAAVAVATLALGIGATSAAFALVNGVLLAPLPYDEPEQLVAVRELSENGNEMSLGWPNYVDLTERSRTLSGLAAYQSPVTTTVLGGAEATRAAVAGVTANLFDLLGVQPARGRLFAPEERVMNGRPAVLVSDAFWRTQLGATEDLSSQALEGLGVPAQVIGVMPPEFDFPRGAEIWYPIELNDPSTLGTRTAHNFRAVGRLAPGTSVAAAEAELSSIITELGETEELDAVAMSVTGLRDHGVADSRRALLVLLGASAFVLLVACTNLASALLARAARRRRELAIRASLGAQRLRLMRQLLTESLLLSLLGAAAGLLLAYLLLDGAIALAPDALPRLDEVRLDGWVLAFTTLLAVATALTFGTAPALRATSAQPHDALQDTARGGESPRERRAWSLLIGTEVALALLLLVGSGLLLRSFYRLMQVDPGFDVAQQLTVDVSLPGTRYGDGAARTRFYDELLARVRTLPGVEHAALTMTLPLVTFDPNGLFDIEGGEVGDGDAYYRVVSPDFFETMQTPVVRGRAFTATDRAGAPDVILINQTLAQQYFPNSDPIGQRMRTGGMDSRGFDFATIVGIVGDVRYRSLDEDPTPAYYLNYSQRPDRTINMTLLVRTGGNPQALGAPVRQTIREMDSDVAVEIATLETRVGASFAQRRFLLYVLGGFAASALLLAAVGIYGVVAFAVARRTREIGIRIALGAATPRVLWSVGRATILAVTGGLVIGLAGAAALSRLIASMLYDVAPLDPVTFGSVALLLFATACAAVLIPARRAMRVSPMTALRAE